MGNTVQLKKNSQPVFPVTDVSLVMGLAERPLMDAVYAWDGTGTPDITKIPAGVTVEYNSTTYTGTLAASADTTARFYLVPSTTVQGEYDRYLTDAVSGSYSWKSAGTTAIPTPSIVDNLESTDPTKALSAKQGKVLNEKLGEFEAKVDKTVIPVTEDGKYVETNGGVGNPVGNIVANANYFYIRRSVSAGDEITINGTGGSTPRLWAFVNSSDNIISVSNSGATGNNLSLIAPSGVSYVIINISKQYTYGDCFYLSKDALTKKIQDNIVTVTGNTSRGKNVATISVGGNATNIYNGIDANSEKVADDLFAIGNSRFSMSGQMYRADNGTLYSNAAVYGTPLLGIGGDIRANCILGGSSAPMYGVAFFDEDKNFISGLTSIGGSFSNRAADYVIPTSSFPANAKFFALATISIDLPTAYVLNNEGDVLSKEVYALKQDTESNTADLVVVKEKLECFKEEDIFAYGTPGFGFGTDDASKKMRDAIRGVWLYAYSGATPLPATLYLVYFGNQSGSNRVIFSIYDGPTGRSTPYFAWGKSDGPRSGVETIAISVHSSSPHANEYALYAKIDWDVIYGDYYTPGIAIDTTKIPFHEIETTTVKQRVQSIPVSFVRGFDLDGKTIVCFGDSLTEIKKNGKHYTDYLSEVTGATTINVGIGGAQFRHRAIPVPVFDDTETYSQGDRVCHIENNVVKYYTFTASHTGVWTGTDVTEITESSSPKASFYAYSAMDVISIVEAVVVGDYSKQVAAAKYIKDTLGDDNVDIIERLSAIDFSNVDAVIFFGGANDWNSAVNHLGTSGSTDSDYTLGAINNIIRLILSAYTNLKVFWVSTIVRWENYSGGTGTDANFSDNRVMAAGTLRDYSDAMLAEVKLNHIPACDLYNTLGWNKYNFSRYFPANDGSHPQTDAGLKCLGKAIASFIMSHNTV